MEKRKPTKEELEALEECADWLVKIYESIFRELTDILVTIVENLQPIADERK